MQPLEDHRAFYGASGGAKPLDETHVVHASYGPAGIVTTGAASD